MRRLIGPLPALSHNDHASRIEELRTIKIDERGDSVLREILLPGPLVAKDFWVLEAQHTQLGHTRDEPSEFSGSRTPSLPSIFC